MAIQGSTQLKLVNEKSISALNVDVPVVNAAKKVQTTKAAGSIFVTKGKKQAD